MIHLVTENNNPRLQLVENSLTKLMSNAVSCDIIITDFEDLDSIKAWTRKTKIFLLIVVGDVDHAVVLGDYKKVGLPDFAASYVFIKNDKTQREINHERGFTDLLVLVECHIIDKNPCLDFLADWIVNEKISKKKYS